MIQAQLFAQATGAPHNGASNAEDFQPPTGNPQNNSANTQQQTGGLQTPSDGQVLSDPNLRISVPKNPIDHKPDVQPASSGINWLFVILAAVILVVAAELLFRKREKRGVAISSTPSAPSVTEPEALVEPSPTEPEPQKDKKPKKKSKSKKKNK